MNFKKVYFFLLALLMIMPCLLWAFLDKSFWLWDPAFYATQSIQMWRFLTLHPSEYLHNLLTMMSAKAPMLCWVGEFFSPLGNLIGYEKSFLLMQIIFSFLMILEVMRWKIFSSSTLKTLFAGLMVASTPIFIFQSHFYFVELLQTYSVLLIWGLYLKRKELDVVYITCLYIALFFFSMGVKVTSPFYIIFPSVALLHECWMRRKEYSYKSLTIWPINIWFIFGLFIALIVTAWYLHNIITVYAFAKLASSGPIALLYGVKAAVTTKLIFWFSKTSNLFWGGRTEIIFDCLFAITFLIYWRKILNSAFILAVMQIALVVLMMSFQTNQETRYLYPLFTYWIYIFGATITQNRFLIILFIGIFLFRWVEINLGTLGMWPLKKTSQWSTVVDTQGKNLSNADFILKKIDSDGGINKNIVIATDQSQMHTEGYQFKYLTQHPNAIYNDRVYRIGFWFTNTSVRQALQIIQNCHAGYVITLPAAMLNKINDNLTRVTLPLTTKLRILGWTTLIENQDYLVLKKQDKIPFNKKQQGFL